MLAQMSHPVRNIGYLGSGTILLACPLSCFSLVPFLPVSLGECDAYMARRDAVLRTQRALYHNSETRQPKDRALFALGYSTLIEHDP